MVAPKILLDNYGIVLRSVDPLKKSFEETYNLGDVLKVVKGLQRESPIGSFLRMI